MDGSALRHPVPRLDAPDRLWLLPLPQAAWLAGGLCAGPVLAYAVGWVWGIGAAAAWGLWPVWALWAVCLCVAAAGALVRPGGLHLGRWAGILAAYRLAPRRAVWRPVGHKEAT